MQGYANGESGFIFFKSIFLCVKVRFHLDFLARALRLRLKNLMTGQLS